MTKQSFATALMTMVGAAVFAVSLPAAQGHAEEPGALTKAWDSTREGTEKAWDKTKTGTTEAWDKTKSGTEKAWDKTRTGSAKVWDKTKSGTTDAAHDVGNWGERTGQKIGKTSTAVGHDIHNGFTDDDKK